MAKSNIGFGLRMAIDGLKRFAPYSTSPDATQWQRCNEILRDVEAVILLIDIRKPGLLNTLEDYLEDESVTDQLSDSPEIRALISRYCQKREPLR